MGSAVTDAPIPPGGSVDITVTLRIADPGRFERYAFVELDDGQVEVFAVRGSGSRGRELKVFVEDPRLPADGTAVPFVLLATDSQGDGWSEPPEIVAPTGLEVSVGAWSVVELRSAMRGLRGTRQVAIGSVRRATGASTASPASIEFRHDESSATLLVWPVADSARAEGAATPAPRP